MATATDERDPGAVLRREILEDARRQAERAAARSKRDVQAILATATEAAQRETETLERQTHEYAERRMALRLAKLPIETARLRDARNGALLEELRLATLKSLRARSAAQRRTSTLRAAAAAIAGMEGTQFVVQLSPRGRASWDGAWLAELQGLTARPQLQVSLGADLAEGVEGVVVHDAAGRQLWDNRIESRLARLWPTLRHGLAVRLGLLDGGGVQGSGPAAAVNDAPQVDGEP